MLGISVVGPHWNDVKIECIYFEKDPFTIILQLSLETL